MKANSGGEMAIAGLEARAGGFAGFRRDVLKIYGFFR